MDCALVGAGPVFFFFFLAKNRQKGDKVLWKEKNILLKICQIVTENWVSGGDGGVARFMLLATHLWVLWRRVARLVEICLEMLLPLWLKRVASLVQICLVTLTSLAQKSCQFSPNLPSDAHLFGSKESPV
jgi:hypothetical protein